ncbi:DUF6758 domain-containing protein [Nocardioides dubius]|uniref:Phosphotransacetylase n=1 Tax=Nocardioides dubius TaxID=317019 RepID=A0ABN1TSI5_9ACTN
MALQVTCPRCPTPLRRGTDGWVCARHGAVAALRRPVLADYDAFAEHLRVAQGFPTYLPWPLADAWRVTDFAVVGEAGGAQATLTSVAGSTVRDGPVEITVVAEEPGIGLGARCAGLVHSDPGAQIRDALPGPRIRIDQQALPLWPLSVEGAGLERSVVAGEAQGRWLWLVLRPASALLLLTEGWALADLSHLGAALLDVPFGGPAPPW